MSTKARIENGRVAEILTAEPFPPFHPDLVWVDCPPGTVAGDVYDGAGFSAPSPPQPTSEDFEIAIQAHLDAAAVAHGYDNILSACSYAGAPNPFQTEAQAFVAWRGSVWAYAYAEMAKVQAGQRQMPSLAQIIAELPALALP